MNIVGDERRVFAHWLRTGRYPPERTADGVELKHNPWHDPDDGRFTTKNSGRHESSWGGGSFRGGGGGTFRGGGATAKDVWYRKDEKRPPAVPQSKRPNPASSRPPPVEPKQSAAGVVVGEPQRRRIVTLNGYQFQTDQLSRPLEISGEVTLSTSRSRSKTAQLKAGGADRLPTDDGGHYIAPRFNGPSDAINHFAQDSNQNRGRYRVMEDQWASAKRAGKSVTVRITTSYEGGSRRPSVVNVWFKIDGKLHSQQFVNQLRGGLK